MNEYLKFSLLDLSRMGADDGKKVKEETTNK